MNSSIISISDILNNAEGFLSAGFSEGYNFDDINAAEYFDEVLESSVYPSPIFSGILIMKKQDDKFVIIDGLQRVTTICLLLAALCENYKGTSEKNTETCDKIFNRYLIGNKVPKLRLVGNEKFIYKKLLFSERLTEKEEKSNLVLSYRSFLYKIRERKILGTELFRIISKIQFMVVLLDSLEISTRELYQVINSKDKSQINLISDFISQRGDEEVIKIWDETIEFAKDSNRYEIFEDFMRDFLVIQNEGKTPNRNALYNNFKSYYSKMSKYIPPIGVIGNIVKYSRYYFKIYDANFEDEEIRNQILTLNESDSRDAYPYLMGVLDDLENGHIERDIFIELLNALNTFIRVHQENPNSTQKIDFTTLSTELNKMLILNTPAPSSTEDSKLTINEMNNL